MTTLRIMFALFALIAFATSVSAQSTLSFSGVDRYDAYKGIKIEWPTALPDLAVCKAGEYYEPQATNLAKFATPEDAVRIQKHDECTWMITTTGWRWVLRRAGTKVAVDVHGRDLYDLGRADGLVCKNPRPFSIPILPPILVPTPVFETPALPPPVEITYTLPPREEIVLVPLPPALAVPPTDEFMVELVWDKESKRWFCFDVHRPRDLWKPALCAGIAAIGGYALAGGFSGSAPLVKLPHLVTTTPP